MVTEPARTGNAEFRVASADYFAAMSIPLIRGRLFDERDTRGAPHVAVISASLAETRWPGEDPLGKLIQFGNMDGDLTPFTIVGVVGDVQDYGVGTRALPTFYADFRQRPVTAAELKVVVQGSIDIAADDGCGAPHRNRAEPRSSRRVQDAARRRLGVARRPALRAAVARHLRRRRARARNDGRLWRRGLHGSAANVGDRRAHGARRAAAATSSDCS